MCMESSKHIRSLQHTLDYFYQKYLDYLAFINHLDYLYYLQNGALLDTLYKLHTFRGTGHIAVFNALAIGHTEHSGEQRVPSFPFAVSRSRASNRQDFVFIRPPGISQIPMGPSSSEWLMSGSERCCFCLKLSPNQTLALRDTRVLLYL